MPRLALLFVLLTLLFLLPENANAAGRRRFAGSNAASSLRSQANYDRASANYRGGYEQYPKFIGGFHYHDLHNIGIPNGDIGLRGNGISMSPW